MDKYTLEGTTPVPAVDLMTWAKWYEAANRTVAESNIGDHLVSTVFLGMDHGFGDGPPLLFETMVFKGASNSDLWCERCSTWEEAVAMHERVCAHVRSNLMS